MDKKEEWVAEPVEAMQLAFELGGLEDGSYHLEADELERVIKSAMDAAQPAPDVSGLVEALELMVTTQNDLIALTRIPHLIARDALAAWMGNDGEK